MGYDEGLAHRLRELALGKPGVTEQKMFGGVAFLLHGNMFCGIVKDDLMARVGPARHAEALRAPHARIMDFAGRPMVGFVFVAPPGFARDEDLARWVAWTLEFVTPMHPKQKAAKKPDRGPAKEIAAKEAAKRATAAPRAKRRPRA